MDHNFTEKVHGSFYYQDTHTYVPRTPTGADAFQNEITASAAAFNSGQTIRLNFDYAATPRLLLHIGAGWNDSDFGLQTTIHNYDEFKELGLKGRALAVLFSDHYDRRKCELGDRRHEHLGLGVSDPVV